MNKDDQLCSLELSKKLFELGVKQESLFYWECFKDESYNTQYIAFCMSPLNSPPYKHYSAFTVAELGEMLPYYIPNNESPFCSMYRLCESRHLVGYVSMDSKPPIFSFIEKSEAEARAKMLIYLIENKLIEIK